ncbi:hypothetical protein, conserved [Eimeria brunetti]|uniref:HEAT repeat-containing protein n=1 Tax=Eimeria brunetti TaxID=51314 RepID=U6LAP9_9EIME|nr:hypothetical protein, conserved [Eimeria brunetti]
MAAATHCSPARAATANESNTASEGIDWHGVYRDLLFRRGAINPPCTHLKLDEDAKTAFPDRLASDLGIGESENSTDNGLGGDEMSKDPASLVQDFLSGSPAVRKRGCRNISCIFRALGSAVDEFLLFLQDFEEGEDNEDVLATLCSELKGFFDGSDNRRNGRDECPHIWAGGLSIVSSLLLRIMLHRDKELQAAALEAFRALVSSCSHAELLGSKAALQVLDLCEDKQSAPRQAAAALIPTLLHCTRSCSTNLANQELHGTPEDSGDFETLVELKQRLFASYIELCGDKSCSVQLAAGQQLPLFVNYVAEEVETLQQESSTQQAAAGAIDRGSPATDGAIGELMVAVYTATQKFTLSLHESCRMQAVAAIAAMARRNAAAFRAVGNSFFPLLCGDSSWRVRATVCLALEDLALLPCDSAPLSAAEVSKTDGRLSNMTAYLFKFLTDRSHVGDTAFLGDSWMLELSQIAEDSHENQGCRLPGACLDAAIALLPLSTGPQRRAFLELAMELARKGNWKLKISLLGSLGTLASDDISLVAPVIMSSEFVVDEDGEDCWRIQAALAQQLPVLMRTVRGPSGRKLASLFDHLRKLALVKLLGRLLQKNGNRQPDLVDALKQMMEALLCDESAGVREEALEFQEVLPSRVTLPVN